MEQNLTFWNVAILLLGSSVLAAIIGGWIGHLSAARLFKLQRDRDIEFLKVQIAERYNAAERQERKKLNGVLLSKAFRLLEAALVGPLEKFVKSHRELEDCYHENFFLLGFEHNEHKRVSDYLVETHSILLRKVQEFENGKKVEFGWNLSPEEDEKVNISFANLMGALPQGSALEKLMKEAHDYANKTVKPAYSSTQKEMIKNG